MFGLLVEGGGRLRPGPLQPERHALDGAAPVGRRDRGREPRVVPADHGVLQRGQPGIGGGADGCLIHGPVAGIEFGQRLGIERGPRPGQPGELVPVGQREPAPGHVAQHEHVLLLQQFPRLGDPLQRQGLRGDRRAGLGENHLVQQQVGVADQLVVRG